MKKVKRPEVDLELEKAKRAADAERSLRKAAVESALIGLEDDDFLSLSVFRGGGLRIVSLSVRDIRVALYMAGKPQ